MGENGAGKSTLIKAITGALPLDDGELRLDGRAGAVRDHRTTPSCAGIRTVYQEIDLLPEPLGRREHRARPRAAPVRGDRLGADARATRTRCSPISGSTSTPPRSSARTRSPCSSWWRSRGRSRPTSGCSCSTSRPRASTSTRCAELFRVIRDLKERGVAILFVSHFLDQVYEICDRVTVLRDGTLVGEYLTRELLRIDLVQKMLGRSADSLRHPSARCSLADERTAPYLSARGADRRARHQRGGRRPRRGRGARRRRAARVGAHRARPRDHRASTGWTPASSASRAATTSIARPAVRRSRSASSTRRRTGAPRGSSAS